MTTKIDETNIATSLLEDFVAPRISSISYFDGTTAANPAGGETISINGAGFKSGATVKIDGQAVGTVAVISFAQILFTSPAKADGNYSLEVINSDGGNAVHAPGIEYSILPTWSTAAGSLGTYFETTVLSSNTLSGNSDSNVTFSVVSGSLPSGITLQTNGQITGSLGTVNSDTTYTFTVALTDSEGQSAARQFSYTVNADAVSITAPSNNSSINFDNNANVSNTVVATSKAGKSITYSASGLPSNVTINATSGAITGIPSSTVNAVATITATAANTNKSASITLNFVYSAEQIITASALIAGGGGGGGSHNGSYYGGVGAGAGAGGLYLTSNLYISSIETYTVVVGKGGAGGSNGLPGVNGANTTFSGRLSVTNSSPSGLFSNTITALGGGYGGGAAPAGGGSTEGRTGGNGGSGGGGAINSGGGSYGTSGLQPSTLFGGYGNGGAGGSGSGYVGQGGGAGGAGSSTGYGTGLPGPGIWSSITGANVEYCPGAGTSGGKLPTRWGEGGWGWSSEWSGGDGTRGNTGIVIISYPGLIQRYSGGTIDVAGNNIIHIFTANGSLAPSDPSALFIVDYFIVAGGGGGGTGDSSGGGGAGGVLSKVNSLNFSKGVTYTITVGGAGAAGSSGTSSSITNASGLNLEATGGGYGGTFLAWNSATGGASGGSGGGGVGIYGGFTAGGAGISGQGYKGGDGIAFGNGSYKAGGGGGASAAGGAAGATSQGNGGAGIYSSISGSNTAYAGGGGGGAINESGGTSGGTGGVGGGGNGGRTNGTQLASNGTIYTGGGGGNGKSGGSGIVFITCLASGANAASATGAFEYSEANGKRIFKYTGAGTITF